MKYDPQAQTMAATHRDALGQRPGADVASLALQKQCMLDLSRRVRSGFFAYFAIWLAVSPLGGLIGRQPGFVAAVAGVLLAVGVARALLYVRTPALLEAHLGRTRNVFRALATLHSFMWGLLCALTLLWQEVESLRTYMLIAGVAFGLSGTMVMSIDRPLGVAYPAALALPVALAALYKFDLPNLVLAVICAIFVAYVVASTRVLHDDYWSARFATEESEARARQLEVLSLTDALTQIPNRLFFDRRAAIDTADAQRYQTPLAVAMLDLDHFKRVNDQYGHPFGDLCLRATAHALTLALLRPSDFVARYGGEEFVVLLPHTEAEGAVAVAERLRQSVADLSLTYEGLPVKLSCSVGVCAALPGQRLAVEQMVACADEALYRAKQEGRNRVVLGALAVPGGGSEHAPAAPALSV